MTLVLPEHTEDRIAHLCLEHLESVVAVDSSSDESSETVPSTEGQRQLSQQLAEFFAAQGAEITIDDNANLVAYLPGRGTLADADPLALLIHLDTARGSAALPRLERLDNWQGQAIPYPANPELTVSVENYATTRAFLGHDLVFGRGTAPFGLDDKLGLAQMMTTAQLLHAEPSIPHRPLYFVARPDEEIGRMAAVESLADALRERGVSLAYTIDGIFPFEVNVENFNGKGASLRFASEPYELAAPVGEQRGLKLRLGGVNTHGATACEEVHRSGLRFAAELRARCKQSEVSWLSIASDPLRDCDAELELRVASASVEAELRSHIDEIVAEHLPRGASIAIEPSDRCGGDRATERVLDFVERFMANNPDPGFTLWAEDSSGREGYSQPYRVRPETGVGLRLDVRLRDFSSAGMQARCAHVEQLVAATTPAPAIEWSHDYDNLATKLAERPQLVRRATDAARELGLDVAVQPIRGSTGVDPFLERGIYVGNLGTGYFAPESEKEFTSMQLMARHVSWLLSLVQR